MRIFLINFDLSATLQSGFQFRFETEYAASNANCVRIYGGPLRKTQFRSPWHQWCIKLLFDQLGYVRINPTKCSAMSAQHANGNRKSCSIYHRKYSQTYREQGLLLKLMSASISAICIKPADNFRALCAWFGVEREHVMSVLYVFINSWVPEKLDETIYYVSDETRSALYRLQCW